MAESAIQALVQKADPGEAFKGVGSAVGDAFLKARDLANEEEKIRMMKEEMQAKKQYYDQQANQALFDGIKDVTSIKDRKLRKLILQVWSQRYEKMKGEPPSKDFMETLNSVDEQYEKNFRNAFTVISTLPYEKQNQALSELMSKIPSYDAMQILDDLKPFRDENFQKWKVGQETQSRLDAEKIKSERSAQGRQSNFSTEVLKSAISAGAEIPPDVAQRFANGSPTPEDISFVSNSRNQVQVNKENREIQNKDLAEILKNPAVPGFIKDGLKNKATPENYKNQLYLMAQDSIYQSQQNKTDLETQSKMAEIENKKAQTGINQEKLGLEKKKFDLDKEYKRGLLNIRKEGQDKRLGQADKRIYNTAINQVANHGPVKDGIKSVMLAENDLSLLSKDKVTVLEAKEALTGLTRLVQGVGAIPEGREQGLTDAVMPYITNLESTWGKYSGDLSKVYVTPETKNQLKDTISRIRDQMKKFVATNAKRQIDIRAGKVFSQDDVKKLYGLYGVDSASGSSGSRKFSAQEIQGMIQRGGAQKTKDYLKSKGYTDQEIMAAGVK